MNQPYLKSLKFRSLVCFIFLSMVFIIHSCKKEKPSNKTPIVTDSQMVNLARQWYDAKYPGVNNGKLTTQSTEKSTQDWSKAFSPYWAEANTFVIDSLTFIELPALKKGDMAMSLRSGIDPKSFNFSKSGSLTSLIIVNKNGMFYLYAMTILADSTYLKGDYTRVKHNTYRNREADFTGEVFYNRMDGSLVNGWKYTNGLITGAISPAAAGSNPGQVTQSIDKKHVDVFQETDCSTTTTTTYWESCDYYVDDEFYENPFNCSYYTTSSSVTTCTTITSGGGSSAPSPCTMPTGGTTNPSNVSVENTKTIIDVAQPPPGGGSTCGIIDQTNKIGTAGACQTITNNITDPCLKAQVNAAISDGLDSYTSNVANFVFKNNTDFDLTFSQSTTLANNEDGATNCQGDPASQNLFEADVSLNANTMPKASQEFIAATVIHEILHAYMTFSGKLGEFNQHTDMANNYIFTMQKDLKAMFPAMTDEDAEALSWGGLGDTQAWADLLKNNPTLANSIVNINNQYKNATGTKGHRCS